MADMTDRAGTHGRTPLIGRVLPAEEWAEQLQGTALEGAQLDPAHSDVIVVEHDGRVVACWAIMSIIHVEGLWEAEDHRGHAGVSRALLEATVAELRRSGVGEVLTQSLTPEVDTLCEKAGGKRVPGQTWVIPVKEF